MKPLKSGGRSYFSGNKKTAATTPYNSLFIAATKKWVVAVAAKLLNSVVEFSRWNTLFHCYFFIFIMILISNPLL